MTTNGEMTTAESVALALGQLVGAASQCAGVGQERLESFAANASRVVASVAENRDDLEAASRHFTQGVEIGTEAVMQGVLDPVAAESAFCEIERQFPE